jgi:hypothetical protein
VEDGIRATRICDDGRCYPWPLRKETDGGIRRFDCTFTFRFYGFPEDPGLTVTLQAYTTPRSGDDSPWFRQFEFVGADRAHGWIDPDGWISVDVVNGVIGHTELTDVEIWLLVPGQGTLANTFRLDPADDDCGGPV